MKENISMTQEAINVKLMEKEGKDVLLFEIKDEEHPNGITVNLNAEEGKNDFIILFSCILKILLDKPIKFNLVVDDLYTKGLFKDVSKDYIDSLNDEIEKVYNNMELEIK